MTAKISLVRDDEAQVVYRVTTAPEDDGFGGTIGGKTVRAYHMRTSAKDPQYAGVYKIQKLAARDTTIQKPLFSVETDEGEVHEKLTRRQVKNLLGARQARKAFKGMSTEDKQDYRAWKAMVREDRS